MGLDQETLSFKLAHWVAAIRYEDLPEAVVHQVKRSLLDYLGVTIRGSTSKLARSVQAFLRATDGRGEASVVGTGQKLSPSGATLANGTAASVLELDDGHGQAAIHPGATCIPAVLAMAQARKAPARDVILAIAVAYEASSRLGIAVCPAAGDRGFHGTPLVGVLGATLGAAKILGSNALSVAHALGMAGSNAGGLFDYHGGWLNAWCVNAGRVGREGLLCASLAEHEVAGPLDIFDGPKGFAFAFAGGYFDEDRVLQNLGKDWLMLGTAVKIYPCCRRLHPVIDAILSLKTQVPSDHAAVDRIVVETSADSARLDYKTFESTSAAQMSIPYGAAATFVYGAPTLEHFEEASRRDARLLHLVQRVEVKQADDPAIADPTRFIARVSMTVGGASFSTTVSESLGDPGNPVDDEAMVDKFLDLVDPVIGSEKAQRIVAAVWALGEQEDERGEQLQFLEFCSAGS